MRPLAIVAAIVGLSVAPLSARGGQPMANKLDSVMAEPPAAPEDQSSSAFQEWLAQAKKPGSWECDGYDKKFGYCLATIQYHWYNDSDILQIDYFALRIKDGPLIFQATSHSKVSGNQVCNNDLLSIEVRLLNYPEGTPISVREGFVEKLSTFLRTQGSKVCMVFFKRDDQLFEKNLLDGAPMYDGESMHIRFFDEMPPLCSYSKICAEYGHPPG